MPSSSPWTRSWLGIIANPPAYILQRESIEKAAGKYRDSHPPVFSGDGISGARSFEEQRSIWISACASVLKGNDAGKSKVNCEQGCAAVYDTHPAVIQMKAQAEAIGAVQDEQVKAQNEDLTKKIAGGALILIIIVAAIIILK